MIILGSNPNGIKFCETYDLLQTASVLAQFAMWVLSLLTVLRIGAIAVEAFKQSLPSPQEGFAQEFKSNRKINNFRALKTQ
jgi:hypothetical protein